PLDGSPTRNGDAQIFLAETLRSVRDYRSGLDIENAGYPLDEKYPQIYIVGQVTSTWISKVAEWVNALLGYERTLAFVAYVLAEEPAGATAPAGPGLSIPASPVQWVDDLLAQSGDLPMVNFCYIYEEFGQPR